MRTPTFTYIILVRELETLMEPHPATVLGGSLAGELFLWLFYSLIIFPVGNEHNGGWGLDLGLVEPS